MSRWLNIWHCVHEAIIIKTISRVNYSDCLSMSKKEWIMSPTEAISEYTRRSNWVSICKTLDCVQILNLYLIYDSMNYIIPVEHCRTMKKQIGSFLEIYCFVLQFLQQKCRITRYALEGQSSHIYTIKKEKTKIHSWIIQNMSILYRTLWKSMLFVIILSRMVQIWGDCP